MTTHHDERDHGNTHRGGRSPLRIPHEYSDDAKYLKLEKEGTADIGSADTAAAAAAVAAVAAADAAVITIDEAGPPTAVVSRTGSLPPCSDRLKCSKCTFNNCPKAADGEPALPEPSACAVCLNPLNGAVVATDLLPPSPAHHPDPEGHCQPSRSRGGLPSAGVLLPSPSGGDHAALKSSSFPLASQCPLCTVLILDPGITRCPVCCSPLLLPSASGESNVRALVQPECRVCTLRNDPGAAVCRACGTLLFVDGGLHGRSGVPRSADGAGRQGGKDAR